jgi:hypothetical protein
MKNYRIALMAEAISSLPKEELEAKLVAALFDIETEEKISDGDNKQFQVVDYQLTEATPIEKSKL